MEPGELISKRGAIEFVRNMMDIDGFRDGDAVDRRAVMAIMDSMHGKDMSALEDDRK